MTTPAIDVTHQQYGLRSGEMLRWWGAWDPTTFLTSYVEKRQIRPQSKSPGKAPDGKWNRGAWQHHWFSAGGTPAGYSFTLNNSSGSNLAGARSDSDYIVQLGLYSLAQVAPWISQPNSSLSPELWNLENLTRTKLLNGLREENVNLGVALGEINQTAGFLADCANAAFDGLSATKRRARTTTKDLKFWLFNGFDKTPPWHKNRGRGAEQRIKATADKARDLWLQHQFALTPLLNDIDGSARSLDKYVNGDENPDTRVTVKAGSSAQRYGELILAHSSHGGYFDYPVQVEVNSSVHGSVDYHVPVNWTRTFESLGLGNPASLAFELVAYSWILDYLTNTGSWLSSLSADRGATFLDGSLSYIQRLSTITSGTAYRVKPGAVVVSISQPTLLLQLNAGRFARVVVQGAFLPAMIPGVKNRMNLTRMANSIFALTKSYGPNLRI